LRSQHVFVTYSARAVDCAVVSGTPLCVLVIKRHGKLSYTQKARNDDKSWFRVIFSSGDVSHPIILPSASHPAARQHATGTVREPYRIIRAFCLAVACWRVPAWEGGGRGRGSVCARKTLEIDRKMNETMSATPNNGRNRRGSPLTGGNLFCREIFISPIYPPRSAPPSTIVIGQRNGSGC